MPLQMQSVTKQKIINCLQSSLPLHQKLTNLKNMHTNLQLFAQKQIEHNQIQNIQTIHFKLQLLKLCQKCLMLQQKKQQIINYICFQYRQPQSFNQTNQNILSFQKKQLQKLNQQIPEAILNLQIINEFKIKTILHGIKEERESNLQIDPHGINAQTILKLNSYNIQQIRQSKMIPQSQKRSHFNYLKLLANLKLTIDCEISKYYSSILMQYWIEPNNYALIKTLYDIGLIADTHVILAYNRLAKLMDHTHINLPQLIHPEISNHYFSMISRIKNHKQFETAHYDSVYGTIQGNVYLLVDEYQPHSAKIKTISQNEFLRMDAFDQHWVVQGIEPFKFQRVFYYLKHLKNYQS